MRHGRRELQFDAAIMHDARTYAQCLELDKYVCTHKNSYAIVAFAQTFVSALSFPLIPTGFKRGISMASDDFPTAPKQFFEYAKKQQAEMVDVKFVDMLGSWQHCSFTVDHLDEGQFVRGARVR